MYSSTYMLDIAFIEENQDLVTKAMKDRNVPPVDLNVILELDSKRKKTSHDIDSLQQQKKQAANDRNIEEGIKIKKNLQEKEKEFKAIARELTALMNMIPNIPAPETPIGPDESGNQVIEQYGEKTSFSFTPKPHWEIGSDLDIIDSARGAKVTGSRFSFLKGKLVQLQFALINFAIASATDRSVIQKVISSIKEKNPSYDVSDNPFIPVIPPALIKPECLYGMGRLEPKEDKFFLEKDQLFLSGSAEHTLGAMHAGEILNEKDLPIRYIGYSTAFRREAGSYGKDTKGILRQHQFDKLEFESFSIPEKSREEHELFVGMQQYLLSSLGVPYQSVLVCSGDMGTPNQRQVDLEAWMPGQDSYKETHSADYIGSYQARRLGIKVARESGAKELVHTNDATAYAIGRTLIAILENYQKEDGSIEVPEVLQAYVPFKIIEKDQ